MESKAKLRARARSTLRAAELGASLSGEDLAFVLELLGKHRNVAQKVGVGVRSIEVEPVPRWGPAARCFWLTRLDGTRTDFGIESCLSAGNRIQDIRSALRSEVADQVIAFSRRAFAAGPVTCPITGEALERETSHVDHVAPRTFLALATEWIERIGEGRIQLDGQGDGETVLRLADRGLAEDWRWQHGARAVLRVVSKRANLSLLR